MLSDNLLYRTFHAIEAEPFAELIYDDKEYRDRVADFLQTKTFIRISLLLSGKQFLCVCVSNK